MDNDQIAARLYISRNTVKFHVRTIYERLGVHNRVEAARVLAGAAGAVSAA
jgi:LuxR family transcriptional regulator, maltose regulon positive regulatory protein